jgi:hypothetical protein
MEHDYVFHSIIGRKLTPISLRNILKNTSRKLGIHINPLRLRYTHALMLWRYNVDIYVISKMLGQTKVKTTITYLEKKSRSIENSGTTRTWRGGGILAESIPSAKVKEVRIVVKRKRSARPKRETLTEEEIKEYLKMRARRRNQKGT